MSSTQLTLCIMLKDEEHQISRTINSVLPHIASAIILDTGSTDNTIPLLKELLKHIPHEIHNSDFIDFATSKNQLLNLTRDSTISREYLLLIDSNDVLASPIPLLTCDAHFVTFECTSKTNIVNVSKRLSIIRKNKPFYFKYPVHEVLECDEAFTSSMLPVTITHDRTKDKPSIERYSRDVEILKKYLTEHPTDARSKYYLGQSYYHLNDYKNSYEWFTQRANSEPRNEEQYLATLYAFKILTTYFIRSTQLIETLIPSIEKLDTCEAYFLIGVYYLNTEQIEKSHSYAKKACKFEELHCNLVFEPSVYTKDRWQLLRMATERLNH